MEMKIFAEKMKRAYIAEGVPTDVAEAYSTDAVVRALSQNESTEKPE